MKNVNNLKGCYGCRVCELKCPTNCISMKENKNGFLSPIVEEDKCVGCGICIKKCQVFSEKNKPLKDLSYVLQSKEIDNLEKSASGSFFYTVAKTAYEDNVNVFGCIFDEQLKPIIKKALSIDDIEKMCGSKYVESDVLDTYAEVEQLLKDDKAVIYSGLPCQIAGLKNFLMKDYDNLVTIDLICHGTPSRKLFNNYIEYLEKKYNDKVKNIVFRSKKNIPWGRYAEKIVFSKKEILVPSNVDLYYSAFFSNNAFKDSCYSCVYAKGNKVSDITIGDAWGEKLSNVDSKGLSCIIINSNKGNIFFEKYKDLFKYKNTTFESLAKNNKQLLEPSQRTKSINFYKDIDKKDFVEFMRMNDVVITKKYLKLLKFNLKLFINKYIK